MLVPALVGLLAALELALRYAALVALAPGEAVAANGQLQPLRQRVDDRDADAVQSAGDLVAAALAELAAGVEHREHDLGRGPALLLVHVDRDAAAVVGHGDARVGVDPDVDEVALAGQGFVDRVVDDLVDEVMQPARPGGADVHAGSLSYRLEALENGDVLRSVAGAVARGRRVVSQAIPLVHYMSNPDRRELRRAAGAPVPAGTILAAKGPCRGPANVTFCPQMATK